MSDRLPNHPAPMTDPLVNATAASGASQQGQAWGQAEPPSPPEPPPVPIDDTGPDIKRGMPRKGLMTSLMALGAVAAVALTLWPDMTNRRAEPAPLPAPAPQAPMAALLKDNLPPPPPVVDPPAPPVAETQVNVKNDLEELILSSKMEAEDVKLDNQAQNAEEYAAQRGAAARSGQPDPESPEALLKEAMARGDKMVDRMMAAEGQGGRAAATGPARNADEAFLEASAARKPLPVEHIQEAAPKGTLYQGSIIRLVLDGALRSDVAGMVRARVVSDVYDSINLSDLLIPRGSSVDCRYQSAILVGQSRMVLACERLRLPNGKYIKLPGNPASDMEGASGVLAEVDTHFWTRFGSVLMMGVGSTMLSREDRTTTVNSTAGGTTEASTVLGNTLNQVISQTMSRNASIGPTGYVEAGSLFTVVTISDLQLEPYRGRERGAR